MTEPEQRPSMVEEFEATPQGARLLAGARLSGNGSGWIHRAMSARNISEEELLKRLKYSAEKFEQVMDRGTIFDFGAIMHELGYKVKLTVTPLNEEIPEIPPVVPRSRLRKREDTSM